MAGLGLGTIPPRHWGVGHDREKTLTTPGSCSWEMTHRKLLLRVIWTSPSHPDLADSEVRGNRGLPPSAHASSEHSEPARVGGVFPAGRESLDGENGRVVSRARLDRGCELAAWANASSPYISSASLARRPASAKPRDGSRREAGSGVPGPPPPDRFPALSYCSAILVAPRVRGKP